MGLFDFLKNKSSKDYWKQKLDNMGPPITKEQKAYIDNEYAYYKRNTPKIENGIFIEKIGSLENIPYDFSNLKCVHWGAYNQEVKYLYLLEGQNRNQALNDIVALNTLITQSHELTKSEKTKLQIKPDTIRFTTENIRIPKESVYWNLDFSYFSYSPLTESNRKSKYPLILFFTSQNAALDYECQFDYNVQGHIFYLQNGDIGKFSIARYFHSKPTIFYSGNLTTKKFSSAPVKI